MNNNYVLRRKQLLKDFDRSVARIKPALISRYGVIKVDVLIAESHGEYETIIPKIPYIGDRNPMLIFLLPATRSLAIYKTLQRHGGTVEEAGQVAYDIAEKEFSAFPGWVRRIIGTLWFSPIFIRLLKRRAKLSRKRRYPGGYVFDFIEGDTITFDYGIDYIECASCKFLSKQSAIELAPYICAIDNIASEKLGWGLTRTMTLAEGSPRCDFRFKKGGKTHIVLPHSLVQTPTDG